MKEVIREFKRIFNLEDNSIREDKIEAETILKLIKVYLSLDGLDEVYLSPPSIEELTKVKGINEKLAKKLKEEL